MSTHYQDMESIERPRRSLLSILFMPLVAFAGGVAAMGWLLANWSDAASFIGVAPAPAPVQTVAETRSPAIDPVLIAEPVSAAPSAADIEIARRVAQLERRLGSIDVQTRQAAGNADRAEGLLLAFAARRALDRGVGLGYLEGLLRQRFGASQPQAVATIIAASNRPVTLQMLQDSLHTLAPELAVAAPAQGWWSALKAELGGLVTIRKSGSLSTLPSERLTRATERLQAGQVNVAFAELNRLPARDKARDWFAMASRYIAARNALDQIETAALLDPRQATAGPASPPALPARPGGQM